MMGPESNDEPLSLTDPAFWERERQRRSEADATFEAALKARMAPEGSTIDDAAPDPDPVWDWIDKASPEALADARARLEASVPGAIFTAHFAEAARLSAEFEEQLLRVAVVCPGADLEALRRAAWAYAAETFWRPTDALRFGYEAARLGADADLVESVVAGRVTVAEVEQAARAKAAEALESLARPRPWTAEDKAADMARSGTRADRNRERHNAKVYRRGQRRAQAPRRRR